MNNDAVTVADDIIFDRAGVGLRVWVYVRYWNLLTVWVDATIVGDIDLIKINNVGRPVGYFSDRFTILIKSHIVDFTGAGTVSRRLT